jgi:hypothetical protein
MLLVICETGCANCFLLEANVHFSSVFSFLFFSFLLLFEIPLDSPFKQNIYITNAKMLSNSTAGEIAPAFDRAFSEQSPQTWLAGGAFLFVLLTTLTGLAARCLWVTPSRKSGRLARVAAGLASFVYLGSNAHVLVLLLRERTTHHDIAFFVVVWFSVAMTGSFFLCAALSRKLAADAADMLHVAPQLESLNDSQIFVVDLFSFNCFLF